MFARFRNEPARIGAVILVVVNLLIERGLFDMTVGEVTWLNILMVIVFGEGVRNMVYGPKTGKELVTENDYLKEEFVDQ